MVTDGLLDARGEHLTRVADDQWRLRRDLMCQRHRTREHVESRNHLVHEPERTRALDVELFVRQEEGAVFSLLDVPVPMRSFPSW